MSWLQKLHATYEACWQDPDFREPPQVDNEKEIPALLPVSHISQQAHIHVILDEQGNFMHAELLPSKKQIVIPATEDSASRAGKCPPPHPLADKIRYCAKDYVGTKNNFFDGYEKLLAAWCSSPYSHLKARIVHAYISRGTLVRDLLAAGILHADATGRLTSQAPAGTPDSIFTRLGGNTNDQGDALVVWSVEISGDKEPRTWKDTDLQDAWIGFNADQTRQKPMLCMVEGKETLIIGKHPRNIRRPGDGAKLISSNDGSGFTFRGRFREPEDACTVGYELSHKAHNALRWLIARQGYRRGDQAVIAWTEHGLGVPNPVCWPPPDDFDWFAEEEDAASEATVTEPAYVHRDVGQSFSRSLAKALRGYRQNIKDTEGISVLALEAASPGRLSVTFYRERMANDYLDKLEQWQADMAWTLPVKLADAKDARAKTRTVYTEYAPLPETIAQAAFGRRIDDKLLQATVERLLPCIVDATPIPRDLVESCVRRACNRLGLEGREWPTVLGVACALYKGFYARHPQPEKRRTYSMTLDRNRSTRDYLYGRLLAVIEYAERCALERAGEKRPTNAERLMQRFADNPSATRLSLEKHLSPYLQRLQSYEPSPYKKIKRELQDINDKCINIDDFTSSRRLDGEFLIGYHCQLADFYKKKETTSPVQEEERA